MKFSLTFKTPDVTNQIEGDENTLERAEAFLDQWLTYGEYITIDFDIEAETATVREANS